MSSFKASLVALGCLLRGLPLFFRAAPKTPLRVLGIIALDTLHTLRHSRPLPRRRINELAMFLDLEGCANAAWDHKRRCEKEFEALRQRLQPAGLGTCIDAYLARLRELEGHRPAIDGGRQQFDEVRSYREGVARLSMATAAAIALNAECGEHHIRAACDDPDVNTLFHILMQCQIIDDVVDYADDRSAGLPSFLTASASLPMAMELTALSIDRYAASSAAVPGHSIFPLRLTLRIVTATTRFVVNVAYRRHLNAQELGSKDWQIRRVERRPGSR